MMKNTDDLKNEIKGFLDEIGDDGEGRDIIELIYGFTRSGYKEYCAGKGGAA